MVERIGDEHEPRDRARKQRERDTPQPTSGRRVIAWWIEQRHNAILQGEKAALAAMPQIRAKIAQLQKSRLDAAVAAATAKARAEEAARLKAQCAQADKGWTSMLKRDDPACAGVTN